MNNSDISFSIHDGDLKAGRGPEGSATPTTCSDTLYTQALGYFNSLRQPAFFTPGDNDWTDCDRPSNGSYNEPRAAAARAAGPLLHQPVVRAEDDAGRGPVDAAVRRHDQHDAGLDGRAVLPDALRRKPPLDIPQGHLCDAERPGDVQQPLLEWQRRARPGQRPARVRGPERCRPPVATGHVRRGDRARLGRPHDRLAADPGFDQSDGTRAPLRDPKSLAETDGAPDGFQSILTKLRDLTVAFKKPVVLVYGDSHYFRVDKPLRTRPAGGSRTSRVPRRSATTRRTGPTTCTGSRRSSTRKAATSSPSKRRSSQRTASQFQRRSVHEGEASRDAFPSQCPEVDRGERAAARQLQAWHGDRRGVRPTTLLRPHPSFTVCGAQTKGEK